MIAVIYARYSDSKQTEQSIEGQLKVCRKYSEDNGYTILQEYIDRAQSGKTDDRIQFRKMLADSKKKQFDAVIVYAINRFGRNTRQSLNNADSLQSNGVTILSATEKFDNTPSGIMFRTLVMAYDQYFSDELKEKVTRGMTLNAEKCLSNGGTTPLGYKIENKRYVINEDTAPIVQEVFTKYANGMSIKEICNSLNERHLKSAQGAVFNKSSLHTMLCNRKYLGIYIYNGMEIQGGMPKIIEEDLFNKVAEKMILNKKLPGRTRAKAEYLLTGKLFCGHCKTMMIGHSSNKISKNGIIYNYYKCKNSGGSNSCKKKMVHKDYIENIVVDECRKILTPQNIRRIAKESVRIVESFDDRTEIIRLEGFMQEAQKAKENHLVSLRKCDDTAREILIEDLSVLGAEIKELEKQLELEKTRRHKITEKQIVDQLTKLAKGDVNDIVYRKSLIKNLVNKIFLYDDRFTITFTTGDEEVTITDILLSKIEKGLEGTDSCLIKDSVYHRNHRKQRVCGDFLLKINPEKY